MNNSSNYLFDQLEHVLDEAYFFKQDTVIEIYENYLLKIGNWKFVFNELIFVYFMLFYNPENIDEILISFGVSNIKQYINIFKDYSFDYLPEYNKEENKHIKIKSFILLKLFDEEYESLFNKYIDTFFETIEINEYEFVSPIIKKDISIYKRLLLYSLFNVEKSLSNKLNYLTKNKNIQIVDLYIKLINNPHQKFNFETALNDKRRRINELYSKIVTYKNSLQILFKILKTTSEFSLQFDFNDMPKFHINIPFIIMNPDSESFTDNIMVNINNSIFINSKVVSFDFILYKNEGKMYLISFDEIDDVYKKSIVTNNKHNLTHIHDIALLQYFKNINYATLFTFISDHISILDDKTKEAIDKLNYDIIIKFLDAVKTKDINIIKPHLKSICVHEDYLNKLLRASSVSEYKFYIKKIDSLIIDSGCKICGELLSKKELFDNNESNIITKDLEYISEYYKYKNFINSAQILIQKVGKNFNNSIFSSPYNIEHKNFIIQNLIDVTNIFRKNEDYCKDVIKSFSFKYSQFFIFSITNDLFVQTAIVDKYIDVKINNIYIFIIMYFFLYYNIDINYNIYVEIDFVIKLFNMRIAKLCKHINEKYTQDFVKILAYISFIILRYQMWYVDKIPLIKRIVKYSIQIIDTICEFILVIKKLSDIFILDYLYSRIKSKFNYKLALKESLISKRYDFLISDDIYFKLPPKHYQDPPIIKNSILSIFKLIEYKRPNCKLFCPNGNNHILEKDSYTCKICNQTPLDCSYEIDFKEAVLQNVIIEKQVLEFDKLINQSSEKDVIQLIQMMNESNVADLISYNINNSETKMYNKITLKMDILKIEIERDGIFLSTNSTPITLYWVANKLINLEFASIDINIDFNPLGILFFNNFKSDIRFMIDLQFILLQSIQKNIVYGNRTKMKLLFDIIFFINTPRGKELLMQNSRLEMYHNISITQNTSNVNCILMNNYKYFYNLLGFYVYILSSESSFGPCLAEFIKGLNEFISSLKINKAIFKNNAITL